MDIRNILDWRLLGQEFSPATSLLIIPLSPKFRKPTQYHFKCHTATLWFERLQGNGEILEHMGLHLNSFTNSELPYQSLESRLIISNSFVHTLLWWEGDEHISREEARAEEKEREKMVAKFLFWYYYPVLVLIISWFRRRSSFCPGKRWAQTTLLSLNMGRKKIDQLSQKKRDSPGQVNTLQTHFPWKWNSP